MNNLPKFTMYSSSFGVDDPQTTAFRKNLIQKKNFLRLLYTEWYKMLQVSDEKIVIELGSGGGFISDVLPTVITSEVFFVPFVNVINDACFICFKDKSVDLIVLVDVFHHIPDVERFLGNAQKCLRPGGKIVMIEPWKTPWSSLIFRYLHPEPFEVTADWSIPRTGPLSGANGALPWIVFTRDYELFQEKFPKLRINNIQLLMPIVYLLSGGLTRYTFIPGYLYGFCRFLENILPKRFFAMFARIEIENQK